MSTPHDRLVAYMLEKAKLLGHPNYFTPEDEEELQQWVTPDATRVLNKLIEAIDNGPRNALPLSDISTCPWCILTGSNCHKCGYAQRHNRCTTDPIDSRDIVNTYRIISQKILPYGYYSLTEYLEHKNAWPQLLAILLNQPQEKSQKFPSNKKTITFPFSQFYFLLGLLSKKYCPSDFELEENCLLTCEECWLKAINSQLLKQKDF